MIGTILLLNSSKTSGIIINPWLQVSAETENVKQ